MDSKEKERKLQFLKENKIPIPPEKHYIRIRDAKERMKNALEFFIGELEGKEAKWLPEYDSVAEWLEDNKGKGLFLYGDCGLGKTVLATHVIPALLKGELNDDYYSYLPKVDYPDRANPEHWIRRVNHRPYSLRQISARDLSSHKEDPYNPNRKMYLIDELIEHPHRLIIDDVGVENPIFDYGNKREPVDEIMNAAQTKPYLLIITSNLNAEAITQRYGTRTLDRIIGSTTRIEFNGSSLRDWKKT